MKTPPFIQALKAQLTSPLPGEKAQQRMAPVPRSPVPVNRQEEDAIPSAVLILLFRENSEWFFVLTERSGEVEHHRKQVSLPGGAKEQGETSEETALRETEEELGISRDRIAVVGRLSPLFISVSGFWVEPFIGWSEKALVLTPNPVEVRSVHFASVRRLLDEESVSHEVRQLGGKNVDVPFFQFDTVQVWGATAAILGEFREVLIKVHGEETLDESH